LSDVIIKTFSQSVLETPGIVSGKGRGEKKERGRRRGGEGGSSSSALGTHTHTHPFNGLFPGLPG